MIMKSHILLLIIFLISTHILKASESHISNKIINSPAEDANGTVSGVVLDKSTNKPLQGANIFVKGIRRGAVTNQNGKFIVSNIDPGSYTIVIEYIGYNSKNIKDVLVTAKVTLDLSTIQMVEHLIPLNEIIVTPGSYSIMGDIPSMRQTLTNEDIKMMGWAEDVTRAVQRIPGISSNDFSAKFNIRGGDADEVLVLLDGMQIYQPFHQKDFGGGLFSTIDIETLEGVDLLTGGFTADYGDRMSGVLNMKTKNPNEGERKTSIGFSLMNAGLFSMGTFDKHKVSWLFSVRRGYLDLLNKLMGNEFKLEPSYYDIFGKVNFKLSKSQT